MPQLSTNKLLTLVLGDGGLLDADLGTLLQLGRQAAATRDRDLAARYFTSVLAIEPHHTDALLWLAGVERDPERMAVYLRRLLRLQPGNERAHAGLEWAEAESERQRWVAAGPVGAIALQIAACYGPPRLICDDAMLAEARMLAARPALPELPAAKLRAALRVGDWQLAADLLCGVGLAPDHWPVEADPATVEHLRQRLEADRRRRAVAECYRRAMVATAAADWPTADRYLIRLRLTLPQPLPYGDGRSNGFHGDGRSNGSHGEGSPADITQLERRVAAGLAGRGRTTRRLSLSELPAALRRDRTENHSPSLRVSNKDS